MGSKGIIFLCISLAVIVMTASEVGAKDLAETKNSTPLETTNEVKNTKGVETTMHAQDGDRVYPDGGYPAGHRGGDAGHGGGGCHRRCCRHGRCWCCSYTGEAMDAEP